jgi:ATP-dependent Clp protease protease subunit
MAGFSKKYSSMIMAGVLMAAFSASAADEKPQDSMLLKFEQAQRVVRLTGEVNEESALRVVRELTRMDEDPDHKPVTLIVHSEGGSVVHGIAIIDRMNTMKSKVNTVCEGWAMSMGAVILAAGTGTRSAYANCSIMIHNLSLSTEGKVNEMINDIKDANRRNEILIASLASSTGVPAKQLRWVMEKDFNITTAEARQMGMIDTIIPDTNARKAKPGSRSIPKTALERAGRECFSPEFRKCLDSPWRD